MLISSQYPLSEKLNYTHQKSISYFKQEIDINPDYYYSYVSLAIVYNRLGDDEKTIELYEKAIEINPYKYFAYWNLSLLYMEQKTIEKARKVLLNGLEVIDTDELYLNLGHTYLLTQNEEEAIKCYLRYNDTNNDLWENMNGDFKDVMQPNGVTKTYFDGFVRKIKTALQSN